ncbi:type I 3-dehydroquinase-domain-containing protein [Ampelomyces quisqualis]|uniref:Type I 3-dehydroquinase-domain-containing protein n=1 Tax=Ampelomyces quisqualis TaxID=50730 RepID=A0A6A5QHF9_AMPQU|nr:type I 3-dehydroquinase-domain-containing protein [Ampelomyces quisqualis]
MREDDSPPSSARSSPRSRVVTPIALSSTTDRRIFDSRASIVLVGIPGAGKSTLSLMAAAACQRRVVDIENLFQQATGRSMTQYQKQFGGSNRNLRHAEVLHNALQTFETGAIIVCNGVYRLDAKSQAVLHEFAKTHPVIHVLRESDSVYQYLDTAEKSKLQHVLEVSTPIFRRCSNYEFYNLDETRAAHHSVIPAYQPVVPAFLTLKRAERTFFKYLSLILSNHNTHGKIQNAVPPIEPGHFPLSYLATERRSYTCAVQVLLSDIVLEEIDIEELEFGCDAFELVVEPEQLTLDRAEDITKSIFKVRRSTVIPIIYHVIPASTAVEYTKASYLACMRHGLRMAPEFATIDLTLDEEVIMAMISSRGSTKIIGHLHSSRDWSHPFWIERYNMAMELGCSVVRFTRPAKFMDDNAAIQSFRNTIFAKPRRIPLICYNTGRAGRRSACFNQVLTPVIPEALIKDDAAFEKRVQRNPETSWLTVQEATHILYASFTYDPMEFYILGASAGYSLSPAMHNAAYRTCGMPHHFERIQTEVLNERLDELLRKSNFGGTAISQPFKIRAISLAHSCSRHARAIGAINTLIPVRHLNEDGTVPDADDIELFQERNQAGPVKALYGDNTDWIGIRSCIRRSLSPANAVRPNTCGLVVGAGGMARAAVYAFLQLGVKDIVIFNRTYDNAEKLVAHFTRLTSDPSAAKLFPSFVQASQPHFHILRTREDPWPEKLRAPTIIVSCIPVDSSGETPSPQFTLPIQWMQSPTGGVVIELAYRTLNTPLMRQIREESSASWVCMDGLDLLPEQGFAQFELFTGRRAPRKIMRGEVLRCWTDERGRSNPEMVRTRLEAMEGQEP